MTDERKRLRSRRAKGRFAQFAEGQASAVGMLPLVHTTRAYSFDEMLNSDGLYPKRCPILKEKLIYFFYGRPAYRAKDGNNARFEYEWPIIFIFDPTKIEHIKRVVPFDSGAFYLRLYEEFFDSGSRISDFYLKPSIESARKVVGAFYSDHKEYFHGNSRKNVELRHRQFEAQGVHELARLPGVQGARSGSRKRDERSSAIEIQVGQPVLFKNGLLAIVLPEPYLDDSEVLDALKRWNIDDKVRTYLTLHNLGGEAWVGQIYEIVRKLYQELGYLDGPA